MNKYRNIPTVYNGRRYDSKKEAGYAKQLDMMGLAGKIEERVIIWFPQVSFKFNCGTKMIIDFLVCFADNHWELHDVKGRNKYKRKWVTKTSTYNLKKKMLKHEYGLDIKEV